MRCRIFMHSYSIACCIQTTPYQGTQQQHASQHIVGCHRPRIHALLCCADMVTVQVVKSAARAAAADSGPHLVKGNGLHKSVAFAGGSDDDDRET